MLGSEGIYRPRTFVTSLDCIARMGSVELTRMVSTVMRLLIVLSIQVARWPPRRKPDPKCLCPGCVGSSATDTGRADAGVDSAAFVVEAGVSFATFGSRELTVESDV
jgi:hypothetical protein